MARNKVDLNDDTNWPFHLTIPQVAKILHISDAKGYQMARDGELPIIKLGKVVRVPRNQFKEWLEKQIISGQAM